jgi:transposase
MAKPSGRHRNKSKGLGVIWEIPDELWERIEPILVEYWPRKATGRRCADWRRALNGIIFRMRSGCQWNRLPRQFGDDSTVHRWFQRWNKDGVMERIWAALVEDCAELGGVNWQWQASAGCSRRPTRRCSRRCRRSWLRTTPPRTTPPFGWRA